MAEKTSTTLQYQGLNVHYTSFWVSIGCVGKLGGSLVFSDITS